MQLAHMLGKDFHAEAEVKSTEEDNHISEMLFDFLIDTEGRDEQEREKIIQAAAKKLSNCASSSARSIKVFPPTRISPRNKRHVKSPPDGR